MKRWRFGKKKEPAPPLTEQVQPQLQRPSMTLEDIYSKHGDFVWRTLRRHGIPQEDSADAIQEVFLTVHRTLDRFEGRSSLTTWLFTICRSVARDRSRRAHRRYEISYADLAGDGVDVRADAEARVEHNRRLGLLETILAGLDEDLRNVFILFELEDMTGEEISEAIGVPVGTVYSRLRLARTAFRQAVARIEEGKNLPVRRVGGKA